MNTRVARVRVNHYGKTGKYGPNVYKVGDTDERVLRLAGWERVHKGRDYVFMSCPDGTTAPKKEFTVTISVPTDEEVLAAAKEYHTAHKNHERGVTGVVDGWVVKYQPFGSILFVEGPRTLYAPGRMGEVTSLGGAAHRAKVAEFIFGFVDPWQVVVRWDNGIDAPPTIVSRSGEVDG